MTQPPAVGTEAAGSPALDAAALDRPAGGRIEGLGALTRTDVARRGMRVFYYGALAAVLGVLALVAAATGPTLFGYHTYVVNGGSMEPSLQTGSVAVAKPTSPFALTVGDVIARREAPGEVPVLHRIIEVNIVDGERAFTTQGDQNQSPDLTPIVLAGPGDKVVYSVPYAGYILNFASTWLGRLLLIGAPLALIAFGYARALRRWLPQRASAFLVRPEPAPAALSPEPEQPMSRERPQLRLIPQPSPLRDDELPVFLLDQLRQRRGGDRQPEPEERQVA